MTIKLFSTRLHVLLLAFISTNFTTLKAATDSKTSIHFIQVQTETKDSVKIGLLNQLAAQYIPAQPDSAIFYGELALKLAGRTKQFAHINETHKLLGWCYYQQQDFKKAQLHLQSALSIETLTVPEKNQLYEAVAIAAENNRDFTNAYQFLKKSQQIKDALNQQKQTIELSDLQRQADLQQQLHEADLKQKTEQLKLEKESGDQLKQIFIASELLLMVVIGLLCFLLYHNTKKFKKVIQQKETAIAEAQTQYTQLQNKMAGYEQLLREIETEKRENKIQKIEIESAPVSISEATPQQLSLIDYYPNANAEDRNTIRPLLHQFFRVVSHELQIIEQAFAKHDWNAINSSLQNMKLVMHDLKLSKSEILINEINEHISSNTTNRAVAKLMQIKSASTKAMSAINEILKPVN